jgi:hypothetical protein
MSGRWTRRGFLGAAGGILASAELSILSSLSLPGLRPVSAGEARLDPRLVRFDPDIEPLVRLLEDTPRERLLERVAAEIQRGLAYRDLLAALLLAGVRNIQPRPVGFKFHAVLVVNSAHLASQASPDEDRWLPIFWALDYFKDSQAADAREGDWGLAPVDEARVPPARRARQAFIEAMEGWDVEAADAATAGLVRSAGANEVFDLFARLGARDFRDIGHKAIYVSNSWRTLQSIGWRHAEPVLRSLAYALLEHEGENPARRDGEPDRAGRRSKELAARFPAGWQEGKPSGQATAEMLALLRGGSSEEAAGGVLRLLEKGAAPESIWEAIHAGAGELLARQPGIVSLHAVTSTNALHYAFRTTGNEETRRFLLLQNAAFLALFRKAMEGRGKIADLRLDQLEPAEAGHRLPGVQEIFAEVSKDRLAAARKTLAALQGGVPARKVIDAARRLVFLKGRDSHDYKFSSAVLEDCLTLAPEWRDRALASAMFHFPGSGDPDNGLVKRTRAALEGSRPRRL